ncbi:MAG: YqiA/YcfP family alpha/beta fold hydrolase [Thermostichus sp. DG02_5_bins_236]
MSVIYLHGFGSGPRSTKAAFFQQRLQQIGIPLQVPDLNQGQFSQLTLTRQIQQVCTQLAESAYPSVTLIGSSLGGVVAAWVAERQPCVQRLVLLAPAFGFLSHWLPRLGAEAVEAWQRTGSLSVFHYGEGRPLPLEYKFVTDAQGYPDGALRRPLPTLILHGIQDETIPIQASRDYVAHRSWAQLIPLESDHTLANVLEPIWQASCRFCGWINPST